MGTRFARSFFAGAALLVLAFGAVSSAHALGVLVPAYFDPATSSAWTALNQAAQRVPLIAIMNPNNGPSTATNAAYTQALSALHNAGGQVLGYVHSSYTARPIADVAADVDRYNSFYSIDGIFIDEMTNDSDPAHLEYYQQLYRYIKSKSASYLVMGNPGFNTPEIYLTTPLADALVTFESNVGYPQYVPDAWTQTKPATAFSHLCYAVSAPATMTNYIQLAVGRNVGYIYVTDDVANNPWDTLPTYWSSEVSLVESINRQAASNQPPLLKLSAPTNSAVQLHVTGAPGRYILQISTNLAAWNPLATNMSASGTFSVSDPFSSNRPLRFYRTAQ
jgi:spherulation-specific family 4 protein